MTIKGIVLNVVRCVSKDDVLEYARIFSVIEGLEKEPWGIHSFFLVLCVWVWYSAGWKLVHN